MARWNELPWREDVYKAAEDWRDRCFFKDAALFNDKAIWTWENFEALSERTVRAPINSKDRSEKLNFLQKLERQLQPHDKSAPLIQLSAELIWFISLISTAVSVDTKIANISEILDWSSSLKVDYKDCLDNNVLSGIANPGPYFPRNIFKYWVHLITMLIEWKSLTPDQRNIYLHPDSAWDFAHWWDETWTKKYSELRSRSYSPPLLAEDVQEKPQIRHALLFFLYPDCFERVVSWHDKKKITRDHFNYLSDSQYEEFLNEGGLNTQLAVDKAIFNIRIELEREHGTKELDFYVGKLSGTWDKTSNRFLSNKQLKLKHLASNAANNNEKEHIDDTETQSADDMLDELIDPDDLITKAEEGKKRQVTHYVRERSTSLRNAKISQFLSSSIDGHLKCECCDTDASRYPEDIRKRVFEVHHKTPLADIDTKIEMTVDDLALLCANCHRAIHATNPLQSVEEFKNKLGY